jgi:two-component system, OmpR family, response regulator
MGVGGSLVLPDHIPDVALVSWPQDEALRRRLVAARRPRLLLVDAASPPPPADDELEDWIRYPPDPEELAVRTATLHDRACEACPRPLSLVLDADGVLRADGRWVALPPLESRVLGELLACPGDLVMRRDLVAAGWPDDAPADERALDGVVKRLRRRVGPLGVQIYTLPRLGFLLDYTPDSS